MSQLSLSISHVKPYSTVAASEKRHMDNSNVVTFHIVPYENILTIALRNMNTCMIFSYTTHKISSFH